MINSNKFYNLEYLWYINKLILYHRFDKFIEKYKIKLVFIDKIELKKIFVKEFNNWDNISEEYVLFLEYLIYKIMNNEI